MLRNHRSYNPGPGRNSAWEAKTFAETLACQELRHLGAAAPRAADHHRFLLRVEFGDAVGNFAHRDMDDMGGYRRELELPVLAHIEQRHLFAGLAPIQEFSRTHFPDHGSNTNLCAAAALISSSTTV